MPAALAGKRRGALSCPPEAHGFKRVLAAHTREQLDFALAAFIKVEKKHGILGLKGEDIITKYGH